LLLKSSRRLHSVAEIWRAALLPAVPGATDFSAPAVARGQRRDAGSGEGDERKFSGRTVIQPGKALESYLL